MSARDKPKEDCMLCHGIGMYEQACEGCYPSAQPHVAALEALMSIYDYVDDHDNPDKLETGLLEAFRGAVDAVEDYKALIRAATAGRDAS